MGSNDVPPPHVPKHVVPVSNALLQVGGSCWTAAYALYLVESRRSKSYGMPMFALALNFAWELVYAFQVAESPLERTVFAVWSVIDVGLVYGVVRFGGREWGRQSAWVARHLAAVFAVLLALALWLQWSFANWWIANEVGRREGKFYRGVVGPDTTELGFWTAAFCQAYLSATSLAQLVIRGHSGGVNWWIWASRLTGSIVGLWVNYCWAWYWWPEAHPYVVSEPSIFLFGVSMLSDLVYAPVLWRTRATEKTLADGSKIPADGQPESGSVSIKKMS